MADTLSPDRPKRKYHRGPVIQRLRGLWGSKSDGAAQQKKLRKIRAFREVCQIEALEGNTEAIVEHIAFLTDLLDRGATGAIPTLNTAMRAEGQAGRAQDAAREAAIFAAGPAELNRLKRDTTHEVAHGFRLLIAIRRRLAVVQP